MGIFGNQTGTWNASQCPGADRTNIPGRLAIQMGIHTVYHTTKNITKKKTEGKRGAGGAVHFIFKYLSVPYS